MRVIIKTEVVETTFGHAVFNWIFFLIFLQQNCNFWASKGLFWGEKQKDIANEVLRLFAKQHMC